MHATVQAFQATVPLLLVDDAAAVGVPTGSEDCARTSKEAEFAGRSPPTPAPPS